MSDTAPVTAKTVEALCRIADLEIPPERQARLEPLLSVLIAAANDLNARMSDGRWRSVPPILHFPER